MQGGFVGEPSDTTASQIPPMAEDAEGDNDSKAEESQTAAPFNLDGVIEQTVLLDDDALTIVAEKLEYRNDMAYLTLSITNNTEGELDVMTSTLGYSANYVNGCMMTAGHLSVQLPAGETTEEEIGYSLWELQLYGMKGIGALGLGVRAVNDEFEEVSRVLLKWRHPFTERTRLIQALSLASSIVLLLLKDLDTMSKRLRRSTIASAPPALMLFRPSCSPIRKVKRLLWLSSRIILMMP